MDQIPWRIIKAYGTKKGRNKLSFYLSLLRPPLFCKLFLPRPALFLQTANSGLQTIFPSCGPSPTRRLFRPDRLWPFHGRLRSRSCTVRRLLTGRHIFPGPLHSLRQTPSGTGLHHLMSFWLFWPVWPLSVPCIPCRSMYGSLSRSDLG